ncbi:hypothetical protein UCDDA912_g09125 [Diaporthe ampelina]|uniref:Myb-like domain-containing protein n=1 Tax=Diaporthe ampelina TaxID=1214573 RepID=A0A0G2F8C0_9PEZI|nr:hypothetical protein UCDDA912_g09125 [Diaporthe ampelina]
MDHQSLVPIAQRAILQVLNYHFLSAENGCGLPALDGATRGKITTRIYRLLPLTASTENKRAAHVEIICDAALIVAEKYSINKRWFYAAVQNLASMTLIPSIYEDAGDPVPLSIPHQQEYEDTSSEDDKEMDQEDEEEERVQPPAPTANGAVASKSNNRVFWSEAEIRDVIDLKIAGEPLLAISHRFGRSVSAIQNRWRLVSKPNSTWKGYIEQKTLDMYGESNESKSDGSDSDESDESDDDDDDDEEEAQPPVSAANTGTVADAQAAVAPIRPWTNADIQELVRLKLEGLSNHAIEERMKRPYRSIHMTWLNVVTNTEGRWFNHIFKQVRAKQKSEKRVKASQGCTGADEDVTGRVDSAQVLGKRKRAPSPVAQEKATEPTEPTETTEGNVKGKDVGAEEGNKAQPPITELS